MKYRKLVVLQGEEATAALDELSQFGEEEAIDYLAQFEEQGEITDKPLSHDNVYETEDGYRLTYDKNIGYIALEYIIDD